MGKKNKKCTVFKVVGAKSLKLKSKAKPISGNLKSLKVKEKVLEMDGLLKNIQKDQVMSQCAGCRNTHLQPKETTVEAARRDYYEQKQKRSLQVIADLEAMSQKFDRIVTEH